MTTVSAPSSGIQVLAYTDGGCRGNPGPGGWGFALLHLPTGTTLVQRGGEPHTTNNRMEYTAALRVLQALKDGSHVEIRTDSRLLVQTVTQWMAGWKRRGWKKGDKKPVANLDLVQALDTELQRVHAQFTWVKGHVGEPGNELADSLTNDAMDALAAGLDPEHAQRRDSLPFAVERP